MLLERYNIITYNYNKNSRSKDRDFLGLLARPREEMGSISAA